MLLVYKLFGEEYMREVLDYIIAALVTIGPIIVALISICVSNSRLKKEVEKNVAECKEGRVASENQHSKLSDGQGSLSKEHTSLSKEHQTIQDNLRSIHSLVEINHVKTQTRLQNLNSRQIEILNNSNDILDVFNAMRNEIVLLQNENRELRMRINNKQQSRYIEEDDELEL